MIFSHSSNEIRTAALSLSIKCTPVVSLFRSYHLKYLCNVTPHTQNRDLKNSSIFFQHHNLSRSQPPLINVFRTSITSTLTYIYYFLFCATLIHLTTHTFPISSPQCIHCIHYECAFFSLTFHIHLCNACIQTCLFLCLITLHSNIFCLCIIFLN